MRHVGVKFCGLVRPEDASEAGRLRADYAGVIFAGGPRRLDPAHAADVLDAAGERPRRVGVFGDQDIRDIRRVARAARLDVVQLHADPSAAEVQAVQSETGCAVWAAVRLAGPALPAALPELLAVAHAVVLDAHVPGRLGGTGVRLDWRALAEALRSLRGSGSVVLAGGLTPENVGAAVSLVAPNVVDVSSGVEREVGVKDHRRMQEFLETVRRTRGSAWAQDR